MTFLGLLVTSLFLGVIFTVLLAESVVRGLRSKERSVNQDRKLHVAAVIVLVLWIVTGLSIRHYKTAQTIPYSAKARVNIGECFAYKTMVSSDTYKITGIENKNWTVTLVKDGKSLKASSFDLLKESFRRAVKKVPCP